MYYTSRAFWGAEARYPQLDMLVFALVTVARCLRSYFQAHPIKVLIEASLKKILQREDASGRLMNWVIELSEFDIGYLPWNTVKGKILANFIAEFTEFPEEFENVSMGKAWQVFVDNSSYRARRE